MRKGFFFRCMLWFQIACIECTPESTYIYNRVLGWSIFHQSGLFCFRLLNGSNSSSHHILLGRNRKVNSSKYTPESIRCVCPCVVDQQHLEQSPSCVVYLQFHDWHLLSSSVPMEKNCFFLPGDPGTTKRIRLKIILVQYEKLQFSSLHLCSQSPKGIRRNFFFEERNPKNCYMGIKYSAPARQKQTSPNILEKQNYNSNQTTFRGSVFLQCLKTKRINLISSQTVEILIKFMQKNIKNFNCSCVS